MAGPLVGRDRERAVLESAVESARANRGTVVHLVGEPGIGKTTLCEHAVEVARRAGLSTVWGRAAEGAPAFWPWRRTIERWPTDDGALERFELFEAVLDALVARAAAGGLLVVLDDLHWADEVSLRLLEHVAPALREHPILALVTSRRAEAGQGTTLAEVAATLARQGTVLELDGLGVAEIAEIAAGVAEAPVGERTATAIRELTNGNPFFVEQVARLVAQAGSADLEQLQVPAGVEAVVRQRVAALGPETGEVLTVAAALGRSFELRHLRSLLGGDPGGDVQAAVDAGLLTVDPARPDRIQFVHALVRDALHVAIPVGRRAELHAAALRELGQVEHSPPSILLGHAVEAAALLGAEPVVRHGLAAARAALAAGAYEDTISLVETALAFHPSPTDHVELSMAAGVAHFHLDDHEASTSALLDAADRAEAGGDLVTAARALLAVGSGRLVGPRFAGAAPRIRRVVAALGGEEPGLRADLLSRLADFEQGADERLAALRQAETLARSSGDDTATGRVLGRLLLHGVTWTSLGERIAMLQELRDTARRTGTTELRLDAEAIATRVLLETGDLDGANQAAAALAADPLVRSGAFDLRAAQIVAATVATARGDLTGAQEQMALLQAELSKRGKDTGAMPVLGTQMVALAFQSGQATSMVPVLQAMRTMPEYGDNLAAVDTALALLLAHGDDRAAAVAAIDAALAHDLETVARDWAGNGVGGCGLLVEAMWLAEHRPPGTAPRLRRLLEPVADRNLVLGMLPIAVLGWGTHHLGLCELFDDRADQAVPLLREAVARHRAMGARPLLGRSLLALAEAEVARLDGAAALAAARDAVAVLRTGALPRLTERAERLLQALGGEPGPSSEVAPRTTTFVFTDLVGSTAATAAAGDDAWVAALDEHASLIRALAVRHGGQVVKGLGDGFMVVFPSAAAGVRFALAATDASALPMTAGVHTGEATAVDGDYHGHHVNLAARVAAAAGAGEVVISDVVTSIIAGDHDLVVGDPRTVDLKGLGPQAIRKVTHRADAH